MRCLFDSICIVLSQVYRFYTGSFLLTRADLLTKALVLSTPHPIEDALTTVAHVPPRGPFSVASFGFFFSFQFPTCANELAVGFIRHSAA